MRAASSSPSSATRGRQVPARGRVPRSIDATRRARPLPPLRRGHHLLAGRRGAEAARRLPPDDAAADGDRARCSARRSTATSADEIAWAFRKLLEHAAAERPLVVVFDDIQWGEATFLDLSSTSRCSRRDAPILLLAWPGRSCSTAGPGWRRRPLRLEPLGDRGRERADRPATIAAGRCRERIARAAGATRSSSRRCSRWRARRRRRVVVPPTIQALLAARLDQLDQDERSVLERGAVEGEIFHRGAVQALAPDEPQVTARLTALVRKELIRPDTARVAGEDALPLPPPAIRDAAYDALPKATRAELHERFADWLERARRRARRAGRAPRLPPRAGLPLPRRARSADDEQLATAPEAT